MQLVTNGCHRCILNILFLVMSECLNKPCNTQSTKETNRKLCVV